MPSDAFRTHPLDHNVASLIRSGRSRINVPREKLCLVAQLFEIVDDSQTPGTLAINGLSVEVPYPARWTSLEESAISDYSR